MSHDPIWHTMAERVRAVSKTSNLPITLALVDAVYPDASDSTRGSLWGFLNRPIRKMDPCWEALVQQVHTAHRVLENFGVKASVEEVVDKMFESDSTRGTLLTLIHNAHPLH